MADWKNVAITDLERQIAELRAECARWKLEARTQMKRAEAAEDWKAEAVKALRPFAEWIATVEENPRVKFPEDASIVAYSASDTPDARITGADFRAARRFYEKEADHDPTGADV